MGRPFRAWVIFATNYPGRCPGLVWSRAFGPQEAGSGACLCVRARRQAGSGFGFGQREAGETAFARRVHGAVPSTMAIPSEKKRVREKKGQEKNLVVVNPPSGDKSARCCLPPRGHRRARRSSRWLGALPAPFGPRPDTKQPPFARPPVPPTALLDNHRRAPSSSPRGLTFLWSRLHVPWH